MSCGLGHKYVQHVCNIHTQRVQPCSCYAVQPSPPEVLAHSSLNDTLNHISLTLHYAECSENVSMELWEQQSRGWQGRGQWGCSPRYNKHVSGVCWAVG